MVTKASLKGEECGMPLSKRRREFLGLVSCGYTTKEIAKRMGCCYNTVKNHARDTYERLGVRCAAHAVSEGYIRGYLKLDKPK